MCTSACQVPLKECERLDHSLALALRHLTSPGPWAEPGTQAELGANAAAEMLAMETGVDTEVHASACTGGPAHAGEHLDPFGEHATAPEDRMGDYYHIKAQWLLSLVPCFT